MECNDEALVSCDFNGYPPPASPTSARPACRGELVKVMAWYDNEWGFSNRMLDVLLHRQAPTPDDRRRPTWCGAGALQLPLAQFRNAVAERALPGCGAVAAVTADSP